MNIIKFPLEKPVTTIMLFVGLALLGIISYFKLPQELFPSLAYPQISIVTKYEGAGPEEAEKLISRMIEETAGTVRNIRRVSSISKEGMSVVICEFRWGTDMNFAALDVREKIDLVKERLPRDAREPVVLKFNPFQTEAMVLSVTYNYNESDPWKMVGLRQFCKKNIKDELERCDGVAKVEIRGGQQKEVLVEVDKGRVLANELSLLDIIKTLRETNITYPAGSVKEEMYEYPVKTVGEFKTIDDIANILLNKENRGPEQLPQKNVRRRTDEVSGHSVIFLRDVGEVKESIKEATGYSRYNRRDNISLSIYPQSGSNLIKISESVKAKLAEIKDRFPKDVQWKVIYDQSDFIKTSLEHIYFDAGIGSFFSFLILFIFLRDVAASMIILVALPLSVLAAISMMYFSDISINTMSLGGLALGVGMVIDNSNVVLEGIFSYASRNPGKDKKTIILEATNLQVGSVVGSTLTLCAIFVPFIFVSGVAGQLFKEMALTITYSMLASVLVALILVPRLAMNLHLEKYAAAEVSQIKWLAKFPSWLRAFLETPRLKTWRWLGLYFAIGIVLLIFVPKEFMPSMDEHRFTMNITLPPQTTLAVTYDLGKRIERSLSNIPEIEDMVVNVGSSGEETSGSIDFVGPNQARIIARLKKNGRSTTEIVSELSDEITKWHIDNMEMEFITKQGLFGSSMGSSSGITIEVKGRDLEKMQRRVERTEGMMERSKTFYGIKTIPSALIPELRLEIDRERASLFGMNVQDISATLLAAIKGYVATKLREKEDEYDVRVRLRKEDRNDLSRIGELTVYSPFGRNIQLQQISELRFVKSLPEIRRIEGQRAYLITANVRGSFDNAIKETKAIFSRLSGPADELSMEITGETLQLQESLSSAAFALIFGIIIVYMILASQFESLVLPVITMTTVPMGLIGAIYGLFFTFQSLNSVSMQGMVMLIGLVVNSGIILVDRYNTARAHEPNKNLKELVIECTGERLRAVVMTTLTTVLGMLPTAMAVGKNTIAPMSIAIVSGEMFRLVLTLFFVPSSYLLIEEFLQRRKNRAVKSENIQ